MNKIKDQDHAGVPHWKWQRRSALVLIPFTLWMVVNIVHHIGLDYESTHAWLSHPLVAILMIIFMIALFYHAKLGMQVIIEDYISDVSTRQSIVRISNLICWLAMFVGLASLIKIVLAA